MISAFKAWVVDFRRKRNFNIYWQRFLSRLEGSLESGACAEKPLEEFNKWLHLALEASHDLELRLRHLPGRVTETNIMIVERLLTMKPVYALLQHVGCSCLHLPPQNQTLRQCLNVLAAQDIVGLGISQKDLRESIRVLLNRLRRVSEDRQQGVLYSYEGQGSGLSGPAFL